MNDVKDLPTIQRAKTSELLNSIKAKKRGDNPSAVIAKEDIKKSINTDELCDQYNRWLSDESIKRFVVQNGYDLEVVGAISEKLQNAASG